MKNERIDPADISVVIQGPIFYSREKNIDYTKKACMSVRKHLPGAEIILSTWKNEITEGLDYDVLIKHPDPGSFSFILPEKMDSGSEIYIMNINRQITSTIGGIKKASRRYVCKIRSDTVLYGDNFLREFCKYDAPIKAPYNEFIKHRVVTLSSVNPRRYHPFAFYLCDWFFFGEKVDVEKMWDIPLIEDSAFNGETRNGLYLMENNFGNEQYMWLGFLKKYMNIDIPNGRTATDKILEHSEESYANCCIFLTAKRAKIRSLKVRDTGYGASPCFSNAGTYTLNEWKKLYNKYGNGHLFIMPNPFEQIIYMLVAQFRGLKRSRMSGVYCQVMRIYHRLKE